LCTEHRVNASISAFAKLLKICQPRPVIFHEHQITNVRGALEEK
jgi:hypothetical protein